VIGPTFDHPEGVNVLVLIENTLSAWEHGSVSPFASHDVTILRMAFDYRAQRHDQRVSWARMILPISFEEAVRFHDPFQGEPTWHSSTR